MQLIKNTLPLLGALALSLTTVACSSDDDSDDTSTETGGDGDGDTTGGDGDGDTTGGDGDGDTTGGDGDGDGDTEECSTILELAAGNEDLSSLVAAVTAAGLGGALEGDDLTVFAPTNDAFDALLTNLDLEFGDLTADNLIPILTYHVGGSVVDAATATTVAQSDMNVYTTLGGTLTLNVEGEDLVLDTAEASATVVLADVEACNGVVHVIDQVLVPSIADIVTSQERFSGLAGLVTASDTTDVNVGAALDGAASEGAWTLFAPNNTAVEGAPAGLMADQVTTALLYHAVNGAEAVPASVAVTLDVDDLVTAGGEEVAIVGNESEGTVTLTDGAGNTVMVTATDIYASNGIIHEIDTVMIPPSLVP